MNCYMMIYLTVGGEAVPHFVESKMQQQVSELVPLPTHTDDAGQHPPAQQSATVKQHFV